MQTLAARTIENPIIKDRVTFLETSVETKGKYTSLLIDLAPKGGNGLHSHRTFDEVFTVRKGRLGLRLGKETFMLEEGETVRVKAGDLHCFFNPSESESVEFHVLIDPGNTGMEIGIQVAYGLARDGRTTNDATPKNLYHMALLLHWTDINVPGFFSLIAPILGWLRQRAVKKGIDRELIRQYCHFTEQD